MILRHAGYGDMLWRVTDDLRERAARENLCAPIYAAPSAYGRVSCCRKEIPLQTRLL